MIVGIYSIIVGDFGNIRSLLKNTVVYISKY